MSVGPPLVLFDDSQRSVAGSPVAIGLVLAV